MDRAKFHGSITALITPFTDGKVDESVIRISSPGRSPKARMASCPAAPRANPRRSRMTNIIA